MFQNKKLQNGQLLLLNLMTDRGYLSHFFLLRSLNPIFIKKNLLDGVKD